MIRAVVFDLWNTLVHSSMGDPFRHLRALLTPEQVLHFPAFKRDAMVRPHASAIALLEGWRPRLGLKDSQFTAIAEVFQKSALDAQTFPEVLDTLERTRQIARLALLSNTQSFDMDFLARVGIEDHIAQRFLSAHTGFLKPEPDAFQAVQKKLGLFPGQLAMVGDSWNDDVQGALEAGWTVLWVNREGLPRPDHDPEAELVEITDLSQVHTVVENLQAGARCSTCLG